jgi:hypothetical protein
MLKNLNKGIATSAAIGIIFLVTIIVGGIITWQMWPKEETLSPTPAVSLAPSPSPVLPPATSEPYIELLSPTGEEEWTIGNTYDIQWKCSDKYDRKPSRLGVNIWLVGKNLKDGSVKIASIPSKVGMNQYNWTIPSTVEIGMSSFKIKIETFDHEFEDESNNYFSIEKEIQITDWKTYTNKEYGFKLKYPNDWRFLESSVPSSYHLGEWIIMGHLLASFEIPEVEYKTNLGFASLVVAVSDDEEVKAQCLRRRFSAPVSGGEKEGEQLTDELDINGVTFYREYYMSSGMSRYGGAESYRTIYKNRCYELVTATEATSAVYLPTETAKFNEKNLENIFGRMLSTFQFLE